MRILYMSGVWSYIVGLTSTPTFIIIPLVSLTPNLLHTPLLHHSPALLPFPLLSPLPSQHVLQCQVHALKQLQRMLAVSAWCLQIMHANIVAVCSLDLLLLAAMC